jgi:SAM-dependent methyltransferase
VRTLPPVIGRTRRVVSRFRATPNRVDGIERHLELVSEHLAAIDSRMAVLANRTDSIPALFLTTESTIIGRSLAAIAELERRVLELDAAAATREREHTDAAVAASERGLWAAALAHVDAAVQASQRAMLEASREHSEAAAAGAQSAATGAAREHAEALSHETLDHLDRQVAAIRREVRAVRSVTAGALRDDESERSVPAAGTAAVPSWDGQIDPAFYVALEDRFRGEPEEITRRQEQYLDLVRGLADDDHPVVDLGSGRGEWLELLRRASVPALGVDANPAFVDECADRGLRVELGDLVAWLRDAPTGSVAAITLFQVVEHLPLPVLMSTFTEAVRVLVPGGVLVAETPNALNLRVAASSFWIDPTHQRPLHPEFLRFCALQAGFATAAGRFSNDLDASWADISDPTLRRLTELVDGPGDFSLIATA